MNRPTPQLSAFLDRPLSVAAALARGGCGGWPVDAWILLSAIISSAASCVWPGIGIDRQRFVEAWMRFGIDEGKLISRPLLMQTLLKQRRNAEERAVAAEFSEVFDREPLPPAVMGRNVDATETVLQALCPTVDPKTFRDHSYPALFYTHVRSALVHEYELGDAAGRRTTQMGPHGVSYTRPFGAIEIYFHSAWLVEQARTIARNAEAALAAAGMPSLPLPISWWSNG